MNNNQGPLPFMRLLPVRSRLKASALVLVLTLLSSASASAKAPWERPWIEAKSPHFHVISGLSERQTRNVLLDLEYFRSAVQLLTTIERFDERVPTTVYLLPEKSAELGIAGDTAGYMRPLMRENLLVVGPSGSFVDDFLKHEYLHFLVHNRDRLIYPSWFDEGYAEYLSSLKATADTIQYGLPVRIRGSALRYGPWLSFTHVLQTRHPAELGQIERAMFYAQSWLLVHYLINGRPGSDFSADLTEYVQLNNGGLAPVPAFEKAFRVGVADLQPILAPYARRVPNIKLELKEPLPTPAPKFRRLPADEVAARLGWIAISVGSFDEAKHYMDASLKLNPRNARALVGQGDLLKFEGKFIEAEPLYIQAMDLEPADPYHELDYAEYLMDRATAFQRLGNQAAAEASFQEARKHYNKSFALDPEIPETLAMHGLSYLLQGIKPDLAVASLEAAHDLLPSHAEIRLVLAKAYLFNGQAAEARAELQKLRAWSHTDGVEQITNLLAEAEAALAEGTPAAAESATSESAIVESSPSVR